MLALSKATFDEKGWIVIMTTLIKFRKKGWNLKNFLLTVLTVVVITASGIHKDVDSLNNN